MKSIIVILVCFLLSVSLFGCRQSTPEHSETQSTNEDIPESTDAVTTEEEIALEMYEKAVRGKIFVHNEYQGEIELKDCLLPGLLKRMEESIVDRKAIIDLDGDGVCEYVIESSLGDSVVLHYFENKVYAYTFSFRNFNNLHTDGSYFWNSTMEDGLDYGASRLRFEGSELIIEPIYTVVNDEKENTVYYIGEDEVTKQEFSTFLDQTCKEFVEYSAFEAPWKKTITESEALEIAEDYWKIKSGDVDRETGYTFALIPKYCETGNYLIALSWLVENHHYSTIEMIEIDAFTGEIIKIKPD